MKRLAIVVVLLAACSAGGAEQTTTTTTAPSSTTSTLSATTTTPAPDCPAAPYELTALPVGVGEGEFDSTVEPDVWTSVAGTNTIFVPRTDDTVAIALVRGTLPAIDWPAEKGEVDIDGTRAVAGPHPDGTWVAGWFEAPGERCDQYTMVFYPPWSPSDVEQVLAGMNRVGG
jgi:hypothetical protein